MAEHRQEHFRRILPIGSERVRRVLDLDAGEGPSRQPPPAVQPPVDRTHHQQRVQEPQPSTSGVVTTPRKHRSILSCIRRRMGVRDQLNIDDYMRELDRDAPRYDTVHDGWTSASEEDISADEDSGDEYLPPGRREERARESDFDFSGFSGLEEEEEVENVQESDSDGDSEGDGPVRGAWGRGRGRARRTGRCGGRGRARSRSPEGADVSDGWTEDPTPPNMHQFSPVPGLTVPVPTTPLDFIQLFLTRELLNYLVDETNDYAQYCRNELRTTLSYQWDRCNITNLAHYLGLQVFFGLLPAFNVRQYWRWGVFLATPNVPALMTLDAFLAMDRYFHGFNRKALPRGNQDRLIAVRPVMEYLQDRCRSLVVPGKNLSLDEGMMAYKGRLSIKVYSPKKAKKYGIKFFFVMESSTGYVLDFSIYSGVYSTLRDTVFGLVDCFRNQGYHLFMDNYYNSVSLAQELYDAGIHCSSTLRLVRGAPTVLQRLGQNLQQLARGDTVWRRKADVFVICWKGVRLVPMITTSDEPMQEEIVQRKKT